MDYRECLIHSDMRIIEAMSLLDKLGTRILLVVTEDNILLGSLTDSDIRRWILNQGSVQGHVVNAANMNPKYITEDNEMSLSELIDEYHVDALPVVNKQHEVVGIEFLYNTELNQRGTLNLPVVMMAGGKGTRLYPYTRILPKPLIPIDDIPISERIMNRFYEFGCEDFYMIVNYKKEMIKAYFHEVELPYSVHFVDEEVSLGTGGGLKLLEGYLNSTFVLSNCDSIIETDYSKLYNYHKAHGNDITFVGSLVNYEIPYGVVEFEEGGRITALKEKPSYSFFTNTGMYIVEPNVFDYIEKQECVGFPTIAQRLMDAGLSVGVYPVSSKSWMDMGQFDSMDEMLKQIQERRTI